MNEGEYLEMVNDLKDQYITMKESLLRRISMLEEKQQPFKYQFILTQFKSPRPLAQQPRYTSSMAMSLYKCRICNRWHPKHSYCMS